ncbi:radical SAM protein [Lachnoclostridium sp. An181]|uniref:radical SAM protein n=1 Tax=Lachnoclostridium sp. An181 TaxID=1965575 RepID=UPI000B36DA26|nr:radical SAM protein [Lachnoclostridium sp. An181]OUP50633.1 radical SAM protein [Lachnoclostridium sp. An181]
MKKPFQSCVICPRNCRVDRTAGQKGFCGMSDRLVAARAALHMWEEPCISGTKGSGTVFFSGCSMGCVYCQNQKIAKAEIGKQISVSRLARIFCNLQDQGAANINLVTPGHFVYQVLEALKLAKQKGLDIPIVYNSSGYEKAETIRILEGYVDVYLPDFKYWEKESARRYSSAPDYRAYAIESLKEMVRQAGKPVFDGDGYMRRGVIVRHLVLPGHVEEAKKIIRYLYETYGDDIYISIMNQYTPLSWVEDYPEINRKLTEEEYEAVVDAAIDLGVENGFVQEGETAKESFIPDFALQGIEKV